MRFLRKFAGACLALALALPGVAQPRWQPQNTMVLVASLTAWPGSPELASSGQPRKDEEFVRQLVRAGVPEDNIIVLKDQRATRQGVQQALTFLGGRAGPKHTLLLYFQGHGDRKGLFCYDYNQHQEGRLDLLELPSLLSGFRGQRLILMGDSRCSGALAGVVEKFSQQHPQLKVLALASAAATGASRANWTYTQALCRVLAGDPSLDQNADQRLSLSEVERFLSLQMKYLENQRAGLYLSGSFEKDFIWRQTAGKAPGKGPGPYQIGDLLLAQDAQGKWWPGEIFKLLKGRYRVRLHDPAGPREQEVEARHLRAFPKSHLEVGQSYEVLSSRKVVTLIRSVEDYFYLAHPVVERGSEGDEWVTADDLRALPQANTTATVNQADGVSRPDATKVISSVPEIRPPMDSLPPVAGDWVAARWRKQWYRARVTGRSQGGYRLRYDDNSSGQAAPSEVIPIASGRPFQPGDRVLACASPTGLMLLGTVTKVGESRLSLRWDPQPATSAGPALAELEVEIELDRVARIRPQDP